MEAWGGISEELHEQAREVVWKPHHDEMEEWKDTRVFVDPQPGVFKMLGRPMVPYSLKNCHLQAIVRMSNIQLTPKKPEYKDDSWHLLLRCGEHF